MPNTYTFISKNVIGSATNVISLTNIPSTYTDLMLMMSCRSSLGENTVTIGFNNSGQSVGVVYKALYARGDSQAPTGTTDWLVIGTASNAQPANSFSVVRCYIQNYASSGDYKTMSVIGGNQGNTNTRYTSMGTASFENTTAISSIQVYNPSTNFEPNSALYLYGISKE